MGEGISLRGSGRGEGIWPEGIRARAYGRDNKKIITGTPKPIP